MDNRKWQVAAVATPPAVEASPSNGVPTDGDPASAIPATKPGAAWFNQIGEELRNVIVGAGLTPSDSNLTQLQLAIQAMIDGRAGQFIVRAASTANINLAAPGAAVDGVTMAVNDLFLPKDQTTGSENGIYIWNGSAVPATRATDADNVAELKSGAIISVREGTINADTLWTLTTDGTIVIGTTALTFTRANPVPVSDYIVGSVTRDISTASGTQDVTGLGFTPKAVSALACVQTTRNMSTGWSDGARNSCVFDDPTSADVYGVISTTHAIALRPSVGNYADGAISIISGGFRITWTKTGAPTGTAYIMYKAER